MKKYHNKDISKSSFLITGGAGFIGSNLVDYLMHFDAKEVRVLDNLSNGDLDNIKEHLDNKRFTFIEGDIRDLTTCEKAIDGVDYISHQAALGSVPRSIKDPITSNSANVTGFLNILDAARRSSTLKRFVYAASSSTYGDSKELPKKEGTEGKPLSPYAVTKLVNELYAEVYSKVYNFHTIGLRYFNVFGPKQSFDNPYAAVIPIFCNNFMNDIPPIINGDGKTSRDFTYVDNAVQANVRSLLHEELSNHVVFNVACGEQTSLLEMVSILSKLANKNLKPEHGPERPGDVKHSLADISRIETTINYKPTVFFEEGLQKVFEWYRNN